MYAVLCQNHNNYYYLIFDKEEAETVIVSSIVGPATINDLEAAIIDAMRRPDKMESIADYYDKLKEGFNGSLFCVQTIAV